VYELRHRSGQWRFKVIHAFTGGADGSTGSLGSLLVDTAGNVFGVTETGGTHSAGVVYELSPAPLGGWKFAPLYEFKGMPDAGFPYGGLVADPHGTLYGTTYFGGAYGLGTVFRLRHTSSGWVEHILHNFKGGTDGSYSTSTLIFDTAGNLYGTTSTGGMTGCDCGTVFKLAAGTWSETIVHRFGAAGDGQNPYYGLAFDMNGNLDSTTAIGGVNTQGTAFSQVP
jgi:uncharacterized repeat protein (TIGR03803 family)